MGKMQRKTQFLYENLCGSGYISNKQAMQMLGVSTSTVRRLFNNLEADGKAIRKYGGLQCVPKINNGYIYEVQEVRHDAEKRAIAAAAAAHVEDGDVLYVDWGTTLYRFCMALVKRMEAGELTDVTVFTNSMVNINLLHPFCPVLCVGGRYRENHRAFTGYLAEETARNVIFTKAFISCDGYSLNLGFTSFDFDSSRLCEVAFTNAKQRFVLMDHSKYEIAATVCFTKRFVVDLLITDTQPPDSVTAALATQVRDIQIAQPITPEEA